MTGRRKGTPCACDTDPCSCGSSKSKCIRAINNVSPDPNGDLEIKAGNGIGISQSGDNSITIINQAMASSFIAGNNIDIIPVSDDLQISVTDDVSINNLNVAGDIIQQGAAYETHAEKIYTTNDYIYMRDGAVGGLAVGAFSGFQVEKYDGTNDGRLVIDNSGVARVGDVGDEQPLLTRNESSDLTDGHLLEWDATNFKAVDSGTDVSAINTAISQKVSQSDFNKIGDFFHIAITSNTTINVGNNWTAVNTYNEVTHRGTSISFSSGNKFTINESGVYSISLTNRHDSGNFGGSGIEYPGGFIEATGQQTNEIRTQFITLAMTVGQTVTIKQYGDQGSIPSYGNLNHCVITRIR